MVKKLGLYYRTIKHLKPIQIRYRLWYFLRDKLRKPIGHTYAYSIPKESHSLRLVDGCPSPVVCRPSLKTFTFLNQSHKFEETIDWNINRYGKLWAYNLNYFEYLHQPDISKEQGLNLINEFINQIKDNNEGLEPYPLSLCGINWIKFLSKHEIEDSSINANLYAQYQILLNNLEYHLLGNHLLENGCSLLFGAYYFRDEELYDRGKHVLTEQLKEQILKDGGHFERSTMYQCILLERLMDCYNLIANNNWGDNNSLEEKLKDKIELMLGWLEQMTVDRRSPMVDRADSTVNDPLSSVKELPLLNDAAKGIALDPSELMNYAGLLELEAEKIALSDSGYRKFSNESFDLICDVGPVGPDYQPAHAHSDTFSFVLYQKGKPVIVDPGISTYENNGRRQLERSTQFHNTVQFENKQQTEVWSAFRAGRRANVDVQVDKKKQLIASHDGYRPWDVTHERRWDISGSGRIIIEDRLVGKENTEGKFFLHFYPAYNDTVKVINNKVRAGHLEIEFDDPCEIKKYKYAWPDGYNRYVNALKFEVRFVDQLTTRLINQRYAQN